MRGLPFGKVARRSFAAGWLRPRDWLGRATLAAVVAAASSLTSNLASASTEVVNATMSGAQEVPPDSSAGTGSCQVTVDTTHSEVTLSGTFSSLSAPATGVALHGPALAGATAPVMAFAGTVTSGASGSFSSTATFVTASAIASILAGQTYCEVDDSAYPSGEIRGQVAGVSAPAMPTAFGAALVALLGGVGLLVANRRARHEYGTCR